MNLSMDSSSSTSILAEIIMKKEKSRRSICNTSELPEGFKNKIQIQTFKT